MFALRFRERTRGALHFHDAPLVEVPVRASFEFSFSILPDALEQKTLDLGGTIDIDGIAHAQKIEGRVLVHWGKERRIRYELGFTGDEGGSYRLVGQKDFFLLAPVRSLTTLPFTLYKDDFHELGDGEVSLDPREELLPSLKSFRVGLLRR